MLITGSVVSPGRPAPPARRSPGPVFVRGASVGHAGRAEATAVLQKPGSLPLDVDGSSPGPVDGIAFVSASEGAVGPCRHVSL